MKRVLSFLLVIVMVFGIFNCVDFSAFAEDSVTVINITNETEKHLIGSTFAVSGSYKSDTYLPNTDTIHYEISGDTTGLIVDGGLSCIGTKENGIISLPLKAIKAGEYIVVLKGPDGAQDSIVIIINDESYNVFLARELISRNKFLSATDTIIATSDYGWIKSNEVMLYFNDVSVQQYVEAMLVRVIVGKVIDEKNIAESYAKSTALVIKCVSGIKGINSALSEEMTFDSITDINLKNQIKTYVNDLYEFNVFDTLSATINGATTILGAAKQASYYRAVADALSVNNIRDVLSVTAGAVYESDYRNTLIAAFNDIISVIENTDLKIAEHYAETTAKYGLKALKSLTVGVAKAFALNAINAVAPGVGTALSVAMTVYEICKTIDDLCKSKIEAVEINLSALSMLCETFKNAIIHSGISLENNSELYSNIIVENYKYLLAANKIAVQIQQDNIAIISKELLKNTTPQPAFSLSQLIKNIQIFGGKTDPLYSMYLVNERYPVVLNTLETIIENEFNYVKTVTEDYLYYCYGMDLFTYTSDLWEIETRYVITLCPNYTTTNSSFDNEYLYFSKGETLDKRCVPYSRSGYQFAGWYTDKSCTYAYDYAPISSNITLYAKWEQQISYADNNDGTATVTNIRLSSSTTSVINSLGEVSLSKSTSNSALEIIQGTASKIPLQIDGKTIVAIAENAVPAKSASVYVPESVKNISNNAINKSTAIVCWSDSYAYTYAVNNGYDYILLNQTTIDDEEPTPEEYFTYTVSDNQVTITGLANGYNPTTLKIPSKIQGKTVSSIGGSAFYGCSSLTSIIIPDSVTSIGGSAFYNTGYYNNKSNWENGALYISNHLIKVTSTYLGTFTVKSATKTIAAGAFAYLSGLRELTIPASTRIYNSESTFAGCEYIEKVILTKGTGVMQNYSYSNSSSENTYYEYTPWYISRFCIKELVLEEGVITIGNNAFNNCYSLKTIILSDSVKSIGESAFRNCDKLTNITIPNSVTSISDLAFRDCDKLTNITIPNSTTYVGNQVFHGCSLLNSVSIGNGVEIIGDYVFFGCSSLTSVTLGNSITNIGHGAFQGCSGLTSITIPNSVKSIDNCAFSECTSLSSIKFGNSITNIGWAAFENCSSLGSIVLPSSLTSIGGSAFSGCIGLKELTMPSSAKIYNSANTFNNCTNIQKVTLTKGTGTMQNYGTNTSGSATDTYYGYTPWYLSRNSIKELVIEEGVENIGDNAFNDCSGLTSIIIPNSVTSIGGHAFYSCSGLKKLTMPVSAKIYDRASPFYNCTNIEIVTLTRGTGTMQNYSSNSAISSANTYYTHTPWYISRNNLKEMVLEDGIESIGASAFCDCGGLTSITIPNSVTSIGNWAFYGCDNLKSIKIPDSVISIGDDAFNGCIRIKTAGSIGSGCDYQFGWTSIIPEYAFCGCSSLENITVPDSVTSIGKSAFRGCRSLTSITIPNSVTSIGNYAFFGCSGLTSITIPNSVKSIDNCAFSECTSLSSIKFGNSITNIGWAAFENCSSLGSIVLPSSLTSIGDSAFCGCIGLKELTMPSSAKIYNSANTFYNCTNIQKVTLTKGTGTMQNYGTNTSGSATDTYYGYTPWYLSRNNLKELVLEDGITNIGNYTFKDCSSLTSITIPDSVTSIGGHAFYSCSGLTSVTISNSITSIGNATFFGCRGLTIVTIPDSVISIGDDAFGCSGLTSIRIPDSVTSISDYAFRGCSSLTCVTIGDSITSIGNCAFNGCELKDIFYTGTRNKWNNIDIKDLNYSLSTAKIHYNTDGVNHYSFVETIKPLCETEGYTLYKCPCAYEKKTDIVPALGHLNDTFSVISPTCTQQGYTAYTCSRCQKSYKDDFVEALGHNFLNGICQNCGLSESDYQIESPHPYENDYDNTWIINKPDAKRIAVTFSEQTETESGYDYIYIYDKNDNEVGRYSGNELSSKRINITGDMVKIRLTSDSSHTCFGFSLSNVQAYYEDCNHINKGTITVGEIEATCISIGYTGDICCAECGEVLEHGEDIAVNKNNHYFYSSIVEPTCTEKGYTQFTCDYCEYSYKTDFTPATGIHYFNNGLCEYCGVVDTDYDFGNRSIELNNSIEVNISKEGEKFYYSFTPEQDIAVAFYSTGNKDTYGYLYDGNFKLLTKNDDWGEWEENGSNFRIECFLRANKTYYFACNLYDSDDTGVFNIHLIPVVTVSLTYSNENLQSQETKIILKNGASEYEIVSSNGQYDFTNLIKGTYNVYYKVKNGLTISAGELDLYDDNSFYTEEDEIYIPIGDVNNDDVIDIADLSVLLATGNYGNANTEIDLTGDGMITIDDIAVALQEQNYGKASVKIV